MKRLLVIRFSALGDVAMTLPVLRRVLNEFPETEITFVTRKQFAPLFENIERLNIVGIDFKKDYNGVSGLFRLSRQLIAQVRPDALMDLHGVLRTFIISAYMRLSGLPCFAIRKDRKLKRRMIRTGKLRPLPHNTERYLDVFRKAGFHLPPRPFILPSVSPCEKDKAAAEEFLSAFSLPVIGFAPFAKHETKTLPATTSETVLKQLHSQFIILLLGGKEDQDKLHDWEVKYKNVYSTCQLSLSMQLAVISKMKAVISMDSGNMHLAAIQGVPVISIWGATHPFLGFSGIQTLPSSWISADINLPCRPCSVFGEKPCSNKEEPLACLRNISSDLIINALRKTVADSHSA